MISSNLSESTFGCGTSTAHKYEFKYICEHFWPLFKVFCADYPFSSISHQSTALCLLFFSPPTRRVHHQMSARAAFSLSCPWCFCHQNRHWHHWGAFSVFLALVISLVISHQWHQHRHWSIFCFLALVISRERHQHWHWHHWGGFSVFFISISSFTSFSSFSLLLSSCHLLSKTPTLTSTPLRSILCFS